MRVLVTGGAGYIGSVCAEELLRQGHEVKVLDDLSTGHREAVPEGASFEEGGIVDGGRDGERLVALFANYRYDAVFHFAAKALVGESMTNPAAYYAANLADSFYFLEAVRAARISRFIFSSSCAVYGNSESPIIEESRKEPTSPYGETKLAFERLLAWYAKAYGISVCAFRYFNAAGATRTHGENHRPETHVIPLLLEAAAGEREFTINGNDYPTPDGTCIRDYVHVLDIAQAHILALQNLESPGFAAYNIGTGRGCSVQELIARVEDVTEKRIPVRIGERRAGDPAVLYANPNLLKRKFGWEPQHSHLDYIIKTAWKWKMRNK